MREAYALSRDWLYFARSKARYIEDIPEETVIELPLGMGVWGSLKSAFRLALLDDLRLAFSYREQARSLRRGEDPV